MTITLEIARRHLRVQHHDEDTVIEGYIAACHAALARFIGREYGAEPELDQAELLLIGMAYEDREGVGQAVAGGWLPPPVMMLARPFRGPTIA